MFYPHSCPSLVVIAIFYLDSRLFAQLHPSHCVFLPPLRPGPQPLLGCYPLGTCSCYILSWPHLAHV